MRWPFRRNRNQETGQDGSAALASGRAPDPAAPSVAPPPSVAPLPGAPRPMVPAPARRDWVGLTPLRPTVALTAPLVAPASAFLPEVSATRSLVHRPAPRPDPALVGPKGRVAGLAEVAPIAALTTAEARPASSASPLPVVTARAAVPVATDRPMTHAPLTHAPEDWVPEGRPPETGPYRTPEWLRFATASAALDPLGLGPPPDDAAPLPEAAPANIPDFLRDLPIGLRPAESTPAATPSSPAPPVRTRRGGPRRRLGLGDPLVHAPTPEPHVPTDAEAGIEPPGEHDDGDDGGASPAEPVHPPVPPAPAGPVLPTYRPAPGAPARPLPPLPQFVAVETPPAPVEAVPQDVADAFQSTHGANVRDVPVRRGPEVSAEARSLRARAYARNGEVFLPREAGALDTPEARGLLAHELTHVVQQRLLGTIPEPESRHGQWLEHEATTAERSFRGAPGAPPPAPLTHPPKASVPREQVADLIEPGIYAERVADELVGRGIAHRSPEGVLEFGPPPDAEPVGAGAAQLAVDIDTSGPTHSQVFDSWSATNDERSATGFEPVRAASFGGEAGSIVDRQNQHYEELIERENDLRDAMGLPPLDPDDEIDAITFYRLWQDAEESVGDEVEALRAEQAQRAIDLAPQFGGAGGGEGGGGQGGRAMAALMGLAAGAAGDDIIEGGMGALGDLFEGAGDMLGGLFGGDGEGAGPRGAMTRLLGGGEDEDEEAEDPTDPANRRRVINQAFDPRDLDDRQLEALARRLYDRMKIHLRRDLLIDRERAGLLSDFR